MSDPVEDSLQVSSFDSGSNHAGSWSLTRLEKVFFQLVVALGKTRTGPSRKWKLFGRVVMWLQILAFVFNREFPWHRASTLGFSDFVYAFQIPVWDPDFAQLNYMGTVASFFVVMSLLTVHFGFWGWCFYALHKEASRQWSLRLLDGSVRLLSSVLFIPFLRVMVMHFGCMPTLQADGSAPFMLLAFPSQVGCFNDPLALVLFSLSILYSALFAVTMLGLDLLLFDPTYNAKYLDNRSTGRIDAMSRVMTVAMVVASHFLQSFQIRAAVFLVYTFLNAFLYVAAIPYYKRFFNMLVTGIWFSGLGAAIAAVYSVLSRASVEAAITFYVLFAAAIPVGGILAWLSYWLQAQYRERIFRPETEQLEAEEGGSSNDDLPAGPVDPTETTGFKRKDRQMKSYCLLNFHLEVAIRFVMDDPTPENLSRAETLLLYQCEHFPSSLCEIIYTQFVTDFKRDPILGRVRVNRAKKFEPVFDERFLILKKESLFEEQRLMDAHGGGVDMLTMTDFRKHLQNARRYHAETLTNFADFWNQLIVDEPQLSRLPPIMTRIERSEQAADFAFEKLISKFSNSRVVLRTFAQYVDEVKMDPEKARELYSKAEMMESVGRRSVGGASAAMMSLGGGASMEDVSSALNSRSTSQNNNSSEIMRRLTAQGRVTELAEKLRTSSAVRSLRMTTCIMFIGLVIFLVIAFALVYDAEATVTSRMSLYEAAGNRTALLMKACYLTRDLHLASIGAFGKNNTATIMPILFGQLGGTLELFEYEHKRASMGLDGVPIPTYPAQKKLVYDRVVTLMQVVDYFPPVLQPRLVNIIDAGMLFIERIAQIIQNPAEELLTPEDEDAFRFIMDNGPNQIYDTLKLSMDLLLEEAVSAASNLRVSLIALLVAFILWLNIPGWVVFQSVFNGIKEERNFALNLFLLIPKSVIRHVLKERKYQQSVIREIRGEQLRGGDSEAQIQAIIDNSKSAVPKAAGAQKPIVTFQDLETIAEASLSQHSEHLLRKLSGSPRKKDGPEAPPTETSHGNGIVVPGNGIVVPLSAEALSALSSAPVSSGNSPRRHHHKERQADQSSPPTDHGHATPKTEAPPILQGDKSLTMKDRTGTSYSLNENSKTKGTIFDASSTSDPGMHVSPNGAASTTAASDGVDPGSRRRSDPSGLMVISPRTAALKDEATPLVAHSSKTSVNTDARSRKEQKKKTSKVSPETAEKMKRIESVTGLKGQGCCAACSARIRNKDGEVKRVCSMRLTVFIMVLSVLFQVGAAVPFVLVPTTTEALAEDYTQIAATIENYVTLQNVSERLSEMAQTFVETGDPTFYEGYQDLRRGGSLEQAINDLRRLDIDADAITTLGNFMAARNNAEHYVNIAFVLAMIRFNVQPDRFPLSFEYPWDMSIETMRKENSLKYPDWAWKYSSRTQDTQLPPSDMANVARSCVFSDIYNDQQDTIYDMILQSYFAVNGAQQVDQQSDLAKVDVLTFVSIAFGIVTLVSVGIVAWIVRVQIAVRWEVGEMSKMTLARFIAILVFLFALCIINIAGMAYTNRYIASTSTPAFQLQAVALEHAVAYFSLNNAVKVLRSFVEIGELDEYQKFVENNNVAKYGFLGVSAAGQGNVGMKVLGHYMTTLEPIMWIAATLAGKAHGYPTTAMPETANITWDYVNEPNYMATLIRYPERTTVYSTRDKDFALSADDQLKIARSIVFDRLYRESLAALNTELAGYQQGWNATLLPQVNAMILQSSVISYTFLSMSVIAILSMFIGYWSIYQTIVAQVKSKEVSIIQQHVEVPLVRSVSRSFWAMSIVCTLVLIAFFVVAFEMETYARDAAWHMEHAHARRSTINLVRYYAAESFAATVGFQPWSANLSSTLPNHYRMLFYINLLPTGVMLNLRLDNAITQARTVRDELFFGTPANDGIFLRNAKETKYMYNLDCVSYIAQRVLENGNQYVDLRTCPGAVMTPAHEGAGGVAPLYARFLEEATNIFETFRYARAAVGSDVDGAGSNNEHITWLRLAADPLNSLVSTSTYILAVEDLRRSKLTQDVATSVFVVCCLILGIVYFLMAYRGIKEIAFEETRTKGMLDMIPKDALAVARGDGEEGDEAEGVPVSGADDAGAGVTPTS